MNSKDQLGSFTGASCCLKLANRSLTKRLGPLSGSVSALTGGTIPSRARPKARYWTTFTATSERNSIPLRASTDHFTKRERKGKGHTATG
ncbi:hypothetical protein N7516_010204 [Penicillium verrucosum]|uniref:uncharacterized protein n=1 Tax=Penicillium verrucosum TaxID=60171 RepID=UPI00254511F8|nr:uncharacterized protein N7516_010204 [Penicillium verrucosum]KAJ5922501.1 hypothetical protein N7516_010204 [Penicillium verrucosum]